MEATQKVEAKPSESTTIVPQLGLFDAPKPAEQAYDLLLEMGYGHDEISVVMSNETQGQFQAGNPVAAASEGTEVPNASAKVLGGAGAMAAAGAASGIIAGIGAAIVVPGLGLLVAGPLAALGASLGAAVGALYGIPFAAMAENEVANYEAKVRDGQVLLSVEPRSPEDREKIQRGWDRINASQEGVKDE
ncbi:MAG TPA: hypothetical protein VGB07_32950 [Blastocatellia bacterium]